MYQKGLYITHKINCDDEDKNNNIDSTSKLKTQIIGSTNEKYFRNVINDSKDTYGFFTPESLENMIIYATIAAEKAKYEDLQPKKRRSSSNSLNSLGTSSNV